MKGTIYNGSNCICAKDLIEDLKAFIVYYNGFVDLICLVSWGTFKFARATLMYSTSL